MKFNNQKLIKILQLISLISFGFFIFFTLAILIKVRPLGWNDISFTQDYTSLHKFILDVTIISGIFFNSLYVLYSGLYEYYKKYYINPKENKI